MYTANKTQAAFQRNNGKAPFQGFKQGQDHLITIVAYDLENKIITGTDQFGKTNAYRIEKKAFERFEAKSAGRPVSKYMGHKIDVNMAKFLPVGRRVVLENAVNTGKDYLGKSLFEGNKIHNSTAQAKAKLFYGLVSATMAPPKKDEAPRIAGIQLWNEQAFSAFDKEALKAFAAKLSENFKLSEAGQYVSYLGFQIRLLEKTASGYTVKDSTHPYDFIPAQKDENGQEISKSSPLSVEKFMAICKEYQEYLNGAFPTWKQDGLTLDICTFTNFMGSKWSSDMEVKREFQPEYKLTSRRSKISADDEAGFNGRNSGVYGVVELTTDTKVIDEETNEVKITVRNMVQKLHCNGVIGEIREMVKAFDGSQVKLDSSLVFVAAKPTKEEVELASPDVQHALAELREFVAEITPQNLPDDNPWDDVDPFGDI